MVSIRSDQTKKQITEELANKGQHSNETIEAVDNILTLKVVIFWKFTSYCGLNPLWSDMGEVVPARTSPTLHPPSPPTVHQLSQLAL